MISTMSQDTDTTPSATSAGTTGMISTMSQETDTTPSATSPGTTYQSVSPVALHLEIIVTLKMINDQLMEMESLALAPPCTTDPCQGRHFKIDEVKNYKTTKNGLWALDGIEDESDIDATLDLTQDVVTAIDASSVTTADQSDATLVLTLLGESNNFMEMHMIVVSDDFLAKVRQVQSVVQAKEQKLTDTVYALIESNNGMDPISIAAVVLLSVGVVMQIVVLIGHWTHKGPQKRHVMFLERQ